MNSYIQMIHRILQRKGTSSYSLRKVVSTAFSDSDNISKGPATTVTNYSVLSFPDDTFGFRGYSSSQVNNELIRTGDILLHVDPTDLSVIPDVSDLVIKSSEVWKIKNIYFYEIYEEIVLYSLHIRK